MADDQHARTEDPLAQMLSPEINSRLGTDKNTKRRFKTCILHIGTEKTGTSAVQNFCLQNRKSLKKEGFYYPSFGKGGSQWEFVTYAHEEPWRNVDLKRTFGVEDQDSLEVYRNQFAERLKTEFSAVKRCHTLIISSEHFHSRLHTHQSVERLKHLLSPWVEEFKVLVWFRRQDRVAVSLNSTHIKSGSTQVLSGFPIGHGPSLRYFNYDDLYQMWSDVFGAENMIPRIYKEKQPTANGLLDELSEILSFDLAGKKLPPQSINASLSRPAFYFLEEINRQLPRYEKGRSNKLAGRLVKDLSRLFPGKHFSVARRQAEDFMSRFEDCNKRLANLAFPQIEGALFDEDFSEYPEDPDDVGLTAKEAVSIALALVQQQENNRSLAVLLRKVLRLQ